MGDPCLGSKRFFRRPLDGINRGTKIKATWRAVALSPLLDATGAGSRGGASPLFLE